MENINTENDLKKSTQRIVDKPIQSEMRGQQEGTSVMFLMYAFLYIIFFSMLFQ